MSLYIYLQNMKRLLTLILSIAFIFWWFSLAESSINEAVSWMNQNWLTIFNNPIDFMATQWLRRDEASKFFVQYAKEVLNLIPDTSKTSCNFTDLNQARPDLKDLIKEACQLWLFQWYNWKFMPTTSYNTTRLTTCAPLSCRTKPS